MKAVIGILMIIGGIVLGLYVGLWWAFIGGIVQIIGEIRAPELSALSVAVGIAKVICAGLLGWLVALFLIAPGAVILKNA